MVTISKLDHLVLTVADMDATLDFYSRVLGFQVVTFGEGRKALKFGEQKINLHQAKAPFKPHALHPGPGTADLCFITPESIHAVLAEVMMEGIEIEDGPVPRSGATGPLLSIYFRDPDGNLIEVAEQIGCAVD